MLSVYYTHIHGVNKPAIVNFLILFFSFRKSVVPGLPVTENTIWSLTGQVVKSLPSRIEKSVFQSLGMDFTHVQICMSNALAATST